MPAHCDWHTPYGQRRQRIIELSWYRAELIGSEFTITVSVRLASFTDSVRLVDLTSLEFASTVSVRLADFTPPDFIATGPVQFDAFTSSEFHVNGYADVCV